MTSPFDGPRTGDTEAGVHPRASRDEAQEREASLRTEVEHLGRIVDEQEREVGRLRRELFLHSTAIGWRLQLRLDPFRKWMIGIPVLRQIYRTWYRALELWVDFGVRRILEQAAVKLRLLLRGRDFLVEDRDRVPQHMVDEDMYQLWLVRHGLSPDARTMETAIAGFAHTPAISVLSLLDVADPSRIAHVVEVLRAQAYDRWELCLAMPDAVHSALAGDVKGAIAREPRLRVAASAGAVATFADAYLLAAGEFVALLDVNDELAKEALFELVARVQQEPAVDIVYSDEDWIAEGGRREEPFFKPDWSPDLLLATNYLERFGIVRRSLIEEAGGFSSSFGPGQAYDLALRLSEKTERIAHVPKVLYHRRRQATTLDAILARHAANRDECRALVDALDRRGRPGRVSPVFARIGSRCYATRFELGSKPLVSIIIPTRNKRQLLETTIRSIREHTDYERYEIIVVDNGSDEPDAVEYLASLPPRAQVHQWNETFNYSSLNNFGVRFAKGEQLLFLNNDMEAIWPDWLTAMLEHAERPEVGAVGAKLLYGDGRIQHAGVVVGINRVAANAFRTWPGETIGNPRLADLTRNCSAVTGACMMVPRRVFDQVGGFDERLRVVLNDVDLCLRIREQGYLVVYTPHAVMYHYEGSSRGRLHPPPDERVFGERWRAFLDRGDPYYSPNLTRHHDDWSIRIDLPERGAEDGI